MEWPIFVVGPCEQPGHSPDHGVGGIRSFLTIDEIVASSVAVTSHQINMAASTSLQHACHKGLNSAHFGTGGVAVAVVDATGDCLQARLEYWITASAVAKDCPEDGPFGDA